MKQPPRSPLRVLFLVKRKEDYNEIVDSHIGLSTGLYNSAGFVRDMLESLGIEAKMVVVVDHNEIDREVHNYRPTHVILEALWVVPTKLPELKRLHPSVIWIIRLHSEIPFLSMEGIGMEWIGEYSAMKNVLIGVNAPRMLRDVGVFLKARNGWTPEQAEQNLVFLPNYYPPKLTPKKFNRDPNRTHIDIGCFGAIRPLKNQLIQAIAALEFAERIGKKLRFHINAGRVEGNGLPILHNLQRMFEQLARAGHEMVSHQWSPHGDFVKLCRSMDIGMQVSFSESFNIVGCDLVQHGVPLVSSREIPWAVHIFAADPTNSADICQKLLRAYHFPSLNVHGNHRELTKYSHRSKQAWADYFLPRR